MQRLSLPWLPIMYFIVTLYICIFYLAVHGFSPNRIVGLLFISVSYVLWIIARLQLGKAFSLKPKVAFLVTTGIYSKLRHPIYLFSILVLVGATIFFESIILLLLTTALTFIELWRREKEEELLLKKFGKKYKDYQKQTWF